MAARRLSWSRSSRSSHSPWLPIPTGFGSDSSATARKYSAWRRRSSSAAADSSSRSDCVLADRLQHRESRLFVGALQPSEAVVGQRREPVDDVEVVSADALRGLEGAAAGEHREPHEQALLVRLEQVVAPVDRRAERALALGCVARAALEQLQTVVEPLQQSRRRQDADPRGGELDRKRQPVEGLCRSRRPVARSRP